MKRFLAVLLLGVACAPEPASTRAFASMEMRGRSTLDELTLERRPPPRVQKVPPPVCSTRGLSLASVAVTSLISRASSMPACATACSWPVGAMVCSL